MTVEVKKIVESGERLEIYRGITSCEETPTFLKLSGEAIRLIPLKDILEVVIHDS